SSIAGGYRSERLPRKFTLRSEACEAAPRLRVHARLPRVNLCRICGIWWAQDGAARRIRYASCRSTQPMVAAAIGVAAMSADVRSQLRKYRNQPVTAPRTNHSGIERMTKNTTHAPN